MVKKLISAQDITECYEQNKTSISVSKHTLITDLATDLAKEYGIEIIIEEEQIIKSDDIDVNDLIALLKQVLSQETPAHFDMEEDQCGATFIKGDTICVAPVKNEEENGISQCVLLSDSQRVISLVKMDPKEYMRTAERNQTYYVKNGCFSIKIKNKRYSLKTGDLFVLPEKTQTMWSVAEKTELLEING